MSEEKQAYTGIFKSTFLFGFVQVFNILAKVGLNKAVALFLGPEGMGIIGLFQSTINILKTSLGLGIPQSAVRDISEARGINKPSKFARTIGVTKKIIWGTALLGALVTIILSPYLSQWTFGSSDYTYAFGWLSIAVFLNILSEGQLSILKGVRQLRALAKASLFGSVVGIVVAIPFYYLFRTEGIVPSLIVSALSTVVFAWYFLRKIKYKKVDVTIKESLKEGQGMIKMGLALMYVTLLGFVTDYIIRSYISNISGIEMVGFFQAGATIVTGYFGIVITAMSTDYYPRISAINKDNKQLEIEVNRQSEVGLILMGFLVVLFMFLMPLFVQILYSKEFAPSINYIEYAVFGTLIVVCSNAMGMILLAKQKSNVFVFSVTFSRIIVIIANIFSYKHYGLQGLGVTAILTALLHLVLMQLIMYKLYNITFNMRTLKMLLIIICFAGVSFFIKDISSNMLKYGLGLLVLSVSFIYSYRQMKLVMGIDLVDFVKNKIGKK